MILFFSVQHFRKLRNNLNVLAVKVLDSQSRSLMVKTLDGSKINSAFHPCEVDKKSTRKVECYKVECLLKVALVLKQLKPIHKKGP